MFLNMSSIGGFLFACCVVYGLTFLIKDSTILEVPRSWVRKVSFFDKLLNCSFCTGCWVGIGIAVWSLCTSDYPLGDLGGLTILPTWAHCLETIIFYMAGAATISYVMDLITQLLENKLHGGD